MCVAAPEKIKVAQVDGDSIDLADFSPPVSGVPVDNFSLYCNGFSLDLVVANH
jgi:hypothetical protein